MKRRRIAPVDVKKIAGTHRPRLHRAVLDGLRRARAQVNVAECIARVQKNDSQDALNALGIRAAVERGLTRG